MRIGGFLLAFLFITFSFKAFSAVFVVTSNADSGLGTLRDALTQAAANGSATKDYINFNLPDLSEAGRTITLTSSLPAVSSNLVIDGTTQPGVKFGRSDSKIIIQPNSEGATGNDPFLLTNVNDFEVYGLYIRDFLGSFPFEGTAVFFVNTCKNIQIGAPGKGNVFVNDGYVFASVYGHYYGNVIAPIFDGVENLTVYSNFFGFEPDGKSYRGLAAGYNPTIDLSGCAGTILIGGDNDNQRNIFANAPMPIECVGTAPQTNHPTTFIIKNNYFSYNIDGQPAPYPAINASTLYTLKISDNEPYTAPLILPYTVQIINNKIQAPCGMEVGVVTGEIICRGNQVNNEVNPTNWSFDAGGISFRSQNNILIGGESSGDLNHLYNTGIFADSPTSILIQRNSSYCINNGYNVVWQSTDQTTKKLPVVKITGLTVNSISGTATPFSKVELFWDDSCPSCLPYTYFTTVSANAEGNWKYNGAIQNGIIASATLNGFTSLFTTAAIMYGGGNVTHYSCGKGGEITGAVFTNTGGYQWKNGNNEIIGTDSEIKNLMPGTYTLTALNGTCSTAYPFTIFDATPKINADNKLITQPSCGKNTGSITGLYLDNNDVLSDAYSRGDYTVYSYKWIDAGGNVKSTSMDLMDVEAGTYHLEVSYKDQCTVIYGPFTLKNSTGPNINQLNAKIQSTNCGQSTGSITYITATGTGTLKFIWTNDQQQQVGTDANLINQPAGIYTLQVTDDTQCGPVYTTAITIPETNGILLDESKVQTTIASCSKDNGSITGIVVSGATQYQWEDANHKVVSTNVDLQNVASGDYTFTASNNFGCSKISKVYHVGQQASTQFPYYNVTVMPTCFGVNSGSIIVAIDNLVKALRWVNSQGENIGNQPSLDALAKGTYQLYLTDNNGCETFYKSYVMPEVPEFIIADHGQQINDQCGLKVGSINNVMITGGEPPYTYKWVNADNQVIGTINTITNLSSGTYILNIADNGCVDLNITYTIIDESEKILAPAVSDVQLCSSGNTVLAVDNPSSSIIYRLYDSPVSSQPIDEQKGGRFNITVGSNRSYYVSQINGTCESPRAEIKVSVGLSVTNIANTFTPNGDGINDYWAIKDIENYPNALVQIFTRSGQQIFQSKGYARPFDGTYNGKKLPVGVYYYIINLSTNCSLLSGSLTIIR